MYFPTADIHANPLLPPLAAFVVSFFTSMGGISGAFLLLPFQMSVLGYVKPSVSATNQLYNVFANPGAILRYSQEGRMVWPLTWIIIAGTLPGVMAGALARVAWLPDPRSFKLFVAMVLMLIAAQMLVKRKANGKSDETHASRLRVDIVEQTLPRVRYTYAGITYTVPVLKVFVISIAVGLVGGAYGIGGGAILSPFLVSMVGLPVYTVAGATLFTTCLTSIAGVLFYMAIAPLFPEQSISPDWLMAILLSAGGFVGMYCGARCQKFIPAIFIRGMMLCVLIGTGLWYTVEFFQAAP